MSRGVDVKRIEEFPRRIRIFVWIIVVLFIFSTFGFMFLSKLDFSDAFFKTVKTLALDFDDNPTIGERVLEYFLSIVGVFLLWWILWSFADMLLEGHLDKYLKTGFYKFRLKKMRNHTIIAGGGRVGEEIARVLANKKESFVVTDMSPMVTENLRKKKYLTIDGSAEQEGVLIEAGIKNAKRLIITIPKTETNILITLSAKELNPQIEIYARAENSKFISKLKKAGAKSVIVPEIVAGDKFAEEILKKR